MKKFPFFSAPESFIGVTVQVLILSVFVYVFGLTLRMLEIPLWLEGDAYRIGDAFLLATADAYKWLAGAEGIITTAHNGRTAIPGIVDFIARSMNVTHAQVAFWLPVFLAPLTAIPACLMAVRWGVPEGGIIAGFLAVAAPGYLHRTRVGFLGDDMLLVLFPLMLIAGMVVWLGPMCRDAWISRNLRGDFRKFAEFPKHWIFFGALLLGGWSRFALWYYPKASVLILAICITGLLVSMVLTKSGQRIAIVCGFMLLLATAMSDANLFAAFTAFTAFLFFFRTTKSFSFTFLLWFTLPGALLAGKLVLHFWTIWENNLNWLAEILARRHGVYELDVLTLSKWLFGRLDTSEDLLNVQQFLYSNISELQNLTPWQTMSLLSGHPVLFMLGLVGFMYLIWKRPMSLLLLPLLCIGLLSFHFGPRYTIFGGVVWGLGLGCGCTLLLRQLIHRKWLRLTIFTMITISLAWFVWPAKEQIEPTPVMHRQTALALQELDAIAAQDATLWIHWDLVNAAQYYARRKAFSATGSPSRLLRIAPPFVAADPTIASKKIHESITYGEVYVVVDFFTLGRVEDMLHAGALLSENQISIGEGMIQMMDGVFPINLKLGILADDDLQTINLNTLDVIDEQGTRRYQWLRNDGYHLVLNSQAHRAYLMDTTMYSTMLVQLFINPAANAFRHFQITVDRTPWSRIFQVTN